MKENVTELDQEMEMQQRTFYNNFCELCKTHGLSKRGLMQKLELSISPITKWKNGAWPDGRTLKKIADYFNITIDELLGNNTTELDITPLGAEEKKLIFAYRHMKEDDKRIIDILVSKYES